MAAKKTSAKRGGKKVAAKKSNTYIEERDKSRRQVTAIILMAAAVLLFLLAVIKGESGWFVLHQGAFGVFGITFYVIPFLIGYLAVVISLENLQKLFVSRIVEVVLLLIFVSSSVYVCESYVADSDYFKAVGDAFLSYSKVGGGALGAVVGVGVGNLLGKTGAAIVCIVASLVLLAIITGTTVNKLITPAKKLKKTVDERRENRVSNDDKVPYDEDYRAKPNFDIPIEKPGKDVFDTGKSTAKKASRKKSVEYGYPQSSKVERTEPEMSIEDIFKTRKQLELEEAAKKAKEKIELAKEKKAMEKEVEAAVSVTSSESVDYTFPPIELLKPNRHTSVAGAQREMEENAEILIDTLESFGVKATITDISRGPSVTRYDVKPAVGVRINKITNLADDIALNLAASGIIIEPVANKSAIGIEVPNKNANMVTLRELIDTSAFRNAKSELTVSLGHDIAGEPRYTDLSKMPHLLIAGTTGSGKSVCLNTMIMSILYKSSPDDVKFIMIDPKGVELSVYNGIPHLLIPVVKNPRKAAGALSWAVQEMLKRYKQFEDRKVRDIASYNKVIEKEKDVPKMPKIVVIIDELADLMMVASAEVEDAICRLAQMARAAGMHLVIATQSPRADIITGLIKANIPSRLALKVSNSLDSRIILDKNGAENLLGNGDLLFSPVGSSKPTRIQGCFVDDSEIVKVVDFVKNNGAATYDEDVAKQIDELATQEKNSKGREEQSASSSDPMIDRAIELVVETGTASTSFLQRRLSVGYARGARIIDELEEMGIIGPSEGSKGRKVLLTKEQWLERNAMSGDDQVTFDDELAEEPDDGIAPF